MKTDPHDATRLCQRLSRYLESNTRELALIRVPSEEEEQARLERGVRPGPNLVRSARAAHTVALDWIGAHVPLPVGRHKSHYAAKTKNHARIGVSAAEKAQRALRSGNVLKHQPSTDPTTTTPM